MAEYKVTITETLQRKVTVEADSAEQAEEKAANMWYKGDIVLTADDFVDKTFTAESLRIRNETTKQYGRNQFTPNVGEIYQNKNGSFYRCLAVDENEQSATMQHTKSYWTFTTKNLEIFPDGKIEWGNSINGYYGEGSPYYTPPENYEEIKEGEETEDTGFVQTM